MGGGAGAAAFAAGGIFAAAGAAIGSGGGGGAGLAPPFFGGMTVPTPGVADRLLGKSNRSERPLDSRQQSNNNDQNQFPGIPRSKNDWKALPPLQRTRDFLTKIETFSKCSKFSKNLATNPLRIARNFAHRRSALCLGTSEAHGESAGHRASQIFSEVGHCKEQKPKFSIENAEINRNFSYLIPTRAISRRILTM